MIDYILKDSVNFNMVRKLSQKENLCCNEVENSNVMIGHMIGKRIQRSFTDQETSKNLSNQTDFKEL